MHFFLSYARDDDADGTVTRFFRDLSASVADHVGCHPAEAGFMDGQIVPGAVWSEALDETLRTAHCFVGLTSPRFVASEFCAREFAMFDHRLTVHRRRHGTPPPALIPLRWIPFATPPEVIEIFQHSNGATGIVYRNDGLKTLQRRHSHREEYENFVEYVARHIVRIAREHPLDSLDPEISLRDMPPDFRRGDPVEQASVRHVYVVVAAGNSEEMAAIRDNATNVYGASAGSWNPYRPGLMSPLGNFAGAVLTSKGYQWTVRDATDLPDVLESARRNNQIVVLVVDVWSADIQRYTIALVDHDREPRPTVPLLVPWTHDDRSEAGQEGDDRLWRVLTEVMPQHVAANDTEVFRPAISSWEKFRDELTSTLVSAQSRMFRIAAIDPGPADESPDPPPVLRSP